MPKRKINHLFVSPFAKTPIKYLKPVGSKLGYDGRYVTKRADGYAALTYAWRDKQIITNYIKNQQEHHKKESFEVELRRLLMEHGVEANERFFP
jgi:hypothetical protein